MQINSITGGLKGGCRMLWVRVSPDEITLSEVRGFLHWWSGLLLLGPAPYFERK